MNNLYTILSILLFSTNLLLGQNITIVNRTNNNTPITSVTYEVDGNLLVQNVSSNNGSYQTHDVILKSVEVNDNGTTKTLSFFNLGGTVTNNNFQSNTNGVGVYKDGNITPASNTAAFETAIDDMCSDSSLLHMLVYDRTSNIPNGNDFDINWQRGLTNDDFIVLGERNGNSFFTIIPLDQDGNIIAGADYIQFRSRYDWNTGFAPSNVNDQPMHLSVVKVDQFNTNVPVHGFRIDNNGEADIRFFMMGDNTFDDNPGSSLPIELVSFEATTTHRQNIYLNWETASEINGDFFEIQHSLDGISFDIIGQENAVGESIEKQFYTYTHANVSSGTHYYRLRMVDKDGTFEFSRTIVITTEGIVKSNINIFPNPTTNNQVTVAFDFSSDRTVQLVNSIGAIVHQTNMQAASEVINFSNLPAGNYQMLITDQKSNVRTVRTISIQ